MVVYSADAPDDNPIPLDTTAKLNSLRKAMRGKRIMRYVITAAQNATPVHEGFFASLKAYCKHNGAELCIIPYRYKNPTSQFTEKDESQDWWASEVMPYLIDHRVDLNANLVLLGDIRIQPTAVRPTSGLETLTGARSAIIGHPKIELVSIPTPQNKLPKVLMTTGAVTQKNYVDAKAGRKGEHHHSFAAVVVEVDGASFYFRQLNASDAGDFFDLRTHYTPKGARPAPPAEGLVLGDLHRRFVDPGVVRATFDAPDSMVNVLEPKQVVLHDSLDFYSQNHHHRGKVFTNLAKHRSSMLSVEEEIDELVAFISERIRRGQRAVFVPSNHPDALARWIESTDWREDLVNAEFYLRTALAMVKSVKMTESGTSVIDPFAYWAKQKLKGVDAVFPSRDESYMIAGIEVGFHGDRGSGGARGSIRGFGKIGVKSIIGHSHTPGIIDGVYQVGTSSRLRLEYNVGPSSWLHCHAVIYPNGKRSLLAIIDGKWRPTERRKAANDNTPRSARRGAS